MVMLGESQVVIQCAFPHLLHLAHESLLHIPGIHHTAVEEKAEVSERKIN